jgi:PAS domain S-box-containing protein
MTTIQAGGLHTSLDDLGRAFDVSVTGMTVISVDGRFLRVNEAFCRSLGYSHDALLGLRWQDVTHPDDIQLSVEAAEATAGPENSSPLTKRYLRSDGKIAWVVIGISPLCPRSLSAAPRSARGPCATAC